ncbi:MAG: D-amino peptidase [Thermotogaceae bacterium]|jgi:D-amino peptidase|nr:D-amino peptidase [Thermotogaceae bacterium]
MKLFCSIDMEGIAGTINWQQEDAFGTRQQVKKCIRKQVEWVIKGIHESKQNHIIDEIVMADSHNNGDSLDYDITELDDRLYLITGSPRPEYMMPMFDKSYDVVFFLGYHAGAGRMQSTMDHTFSSSAFHNVWINGKLVNETLLNAAYAGYHGVPVGLITGDLGLKKQLEEADLLNWVEFIITKEGISRFAAKHYPMNIVQNNTIEAVKKVLNKNLKELPVFKFDSDYDHPIELKIQFNKTEMADVAQFIPDATRIDARTIQYKNHSFKSIFNTLAIFSGLTRITK